jgi:hypothetical protein
MDQPKTPHRVEFKFDERSLATKDFLLERGLSIAHILEMPCYSIEELITGAAETSWELIFAVLKRRHNIHPDLGDRLVLSDFKDALFTPPQEIPDWVIQSTEISKLHYFVLKGGN